MRIANDLAASGAAMAGTDVVVSDPIWIGHAGGYAIQAVWSGTPTGSFKLQSSVDPQEPRAGITPSISNWEDIPSATGSASGAAGMKTWNIADAYYPWVRLVYTNASSTGTLTSVRFNTKGF